MANEGIMALPQSAAMQDEGGAQQPPMVTSFDSYDAAQTALGMVNPGDLAALKESLRQNIADLQLTPSQLTTLIEIFEYVSQNPREYKTIREDLIRNDFVDAEDLPEEYDPEFLGAILAVLNELQMTMAQGAQAPMMEEPPVAGMEGMQPMDMAEGGLADVAAFLAAQGRNGDKILAHITPEEARFLKERGGAGTINPVTGLPEFFFKMIFNAVKSVVKGVVNTAKKVLQSPVGRILGTIALATVLGPAGVGLSMGTAAGLAGAGTTLIAGGSIKEALIAGAMGYIGGGGTIMGANPVAAVGQYLPGAAGGALNTGLATGAIGTGVGLVAGMKPVDALKMGVMSGASAAALQGLQNSKLLSDARFARDMGNELTLQQAQALQAAGEPLNPGPLSGSPPGPVRIAGSAGNNENLFGQGGVTGTAQDFLAGQRVQLPPGAPPEPGYTVAGAKPGFFDSMVTGAKNLYNEYLSPSRPGLPANAGILQKYGPLALAGTAAVAATGGMENKPANQNPAFNRNYTGRDFMRDNPDMFRGGLDTGYQRPSTLNPVVVPTPSYASIPIDQSGVMMPGGVTLSPGGVAQPYNVAGLYGVPLIYGERPPGYAKGGELHPTEFPRKNGPIDGPGTGTSDSIPAMLSDGEFVFTAKAVRNAGGGSRRKGAARMYKLMKKLEGGPVKAK